MMKDENKRVPDRHMEGTTSAMSQLWPKSKVATHHLFVMMPVAHDLPS